MPARMVGEFLRSEKREPSMDAGDVLISTCDQGPGTSSGWRGIIQGSGLWSQILIVLAGMILACSSFAASAPATSAGRALAPALAEKPPSEDEVAAARGMEQLLADLMIQEMRKSIPENDLVPTSQGERVFRQMLDSEYARILSESGTLGVADLVLAQIRGKR